jgi:hypothetical protein
LTCPLLRDDLKASTRELPERRKIALVGRCPRRSASPAIRAAARRGRLGSRRRRLPSLQPDLDFDWPPLLLLQSSAASQDASAARIVGSPARAQAALVAPTEPPVCQHASAGLSAAARVTCSRQPGIARSSASRACRSSRRAESLPCDLSEGRPGTARALGLAQGQILADLSCRRAARELTSPHLRSHRSLCSLF